MIKIKNSKIVITAILTLASLFMMNSASVNAASEAGCYVKRVSAAVITPKTDKVTCPTEGMSRATAGTPGVPGICYLAESNSLVTTQIPDADEFKEEDCNNITSSTPGTSTGATDNKFLGQVETGDLEVGNFCGRGPSEGNKSNEVKVSFDFGCVGDDPEKFTGAALNPIVDIAFAIFRFLSVGVGLIVIGSIVIAGIQYTVSRGDPQATAASIKRISNSLVGLLLYIFMFSIANFLVPGGMFL